MSAKISRLAVLIISLFFSCLIHASTTDRLLRQKDDPVIGNPKGKVSVVEFFDYQCSYCGRMVPTIAAILGKYPQVRFVAKEYPILGPESELAARAALAAKRQGKYQAFSKRLFQLHALDLNSILRLAASLKMNMQQFRKDINSNVVRNELARNSDLGRDLEVNGTPTFFIAKTSATSMQNVTSADASKYDIERAIRKASS